MINNDYYVRKKAELEFLYRILGANELSHISKPLTKFDVLFLKNQLRMMMKCSSINNNFNLTNTNINNVNSVNNWLHVKYSYRRYSAYISDIDFKNSQGIFKFYVNSGMSAISSLLFSAIDLGFHIVSNEAYFETMKLLHRYNKPSLFRKIYYHDSLIERIQPEMYKSGIHFIDSTCLSLLEERTLICQLLHNNSNAVLVRSNTKLDMLGIDYSNIGTVIYLLPRKNEDALFQRLLEMQVQWLGRFGAFPDPCEVPVFWDHKYYSEFSNLNSTRLCRCKYNNQFAFNYISKSSELRLLPNWHNYFVTIPCDDTTKKRFISNFKGFQSKCKKMDLPVYNSGSFGLDVSLFDLYKDWCTGKEYIRISLSDLDFKDIENVLRIFSEFFLS